MFGIRLYEAIGDGGPMTLFVGGDQIYARAPDGRLFNLDDADAAAADGGGGAAAAPGDGARAQAPHGVGGAGASEIGKIFSRSSAGRGNDVHADQLAHAAGGGGSGVGGGLHRPDVAADDAR